MSNKEIRRKERQAIYNTKTWKLLRQSVLRDQPLCQDCLLEGKVTLACEVHHIKSFMKYSKDDPKRLELAFDKSNCVALCKQCHIYRHHPELKALNKYGFYEDEDDTETPDIC